MPRLSDLFSTRCENACCAGKSAIFEKFLLNMGDFGGNAALNFPRHAQRGARNVKKE